jgi:hypothetical protein
MGRPLRLLAVLAFGVALATSLTTTTAVAAPPPTTIEDHNDRLLRNSRAQQAQRTQAAVELYRSMERHVVPAPGAGDVVAAQPPARPLPAARPGVGVVASLLLGLVGGVVGGCAALAGWIATTRRRLRQPVSAT